MKNSSRLILIFIITLLLSACKTFSPSSFSTSPFSPSYSIKEHPLIDRIWSVNEQRFIPADTLKSQILNYDVILLGETHDNARHHQLQAKMIEQLINQQHSPGVAFEMLNEKQQARIDQFQQDHRSSSNKTDRFAKVIQWEESGWPEWPYYRPVFYQAIENDLPIIAANLELAFIRKVIKQGKEVLDQDMQALIKKYQYNDALKHDLEQDILAAHCDMLPEKMLAPMLLGQQVRDLSITRSLLATLKEQQKPEKVVLIAGSGHTRKDYGIPYYLQQEAPEKQVISLAFIEVQQDGLKPVDYAKSWAVQENEGAQLPFDYVWFTPKAKRDDQCEKMKAHMKKKKQ